MWLAHEYLYLVNSAMLKFLFLLERGKPSGHDVDILITHQDDAKIEGLLSKLVERLEHLVSS